MTYQVTGPLAVLTVCGALDHNTGAVFQRHIDAIFDGEAPAALVADVSGVDFCDSSGLAAFLALHRRLAAMGGQLSLVGVGGRVARLLEITKLDRLFRLYPTLDEARASVGGQRSPL
ncbi:STAS domain-containing protein [Sphaerisporangium aureirubrum]|uniref:Anti-sigma factor antagonist n=1 Tax=Sphaerisporangium aureirubrum TaxID=1544736 RepID=A0ABW1NEW7_9ACTN